MKEKRVFVLFKRFQFVATPLQLLTGIFSVGFIIILASAGVMYVNQKKNEFKTTLDPQKAKEIALSLKEEVSQVYVLPDGDPVVATVTDQENLPDDPFYKKAENGDKILLFESSHQVILYRPSIKKVVDVGQVEGPAEPPPLEVVAGVSTPESASSAPLLQSQPRILFKAQNKENLAE